MGLGADPLFCGRNPLRYREHIRVDYVQTARTLQCGRSPVHQLALLAMGYQTVLEPVRGHHKNQKMVGPRHAKPHRDGLGGRRFLHSALVLPAEHACFVVTGGL